MTQSVTISIADLVYNEMEAEKQAANYSVRSSFYEEILRMGLVEWRSKNIKSQTIPAEASE